MVFGRLAHDLVRIVAVQAVGTDAYFVGPILLVLLRRRVGQQAANNCKETEHRRELHDPTSPVLPEYVQLQSGYGVSLKLRGETGRLPLPAALFRENYSVLLSRTGTALQIACAAGCSMCWSPAQTASRQEMFPANRILEYWSS